MEPNSVVETAKNFIEITSCDLTALYYTYSTISQTLAAVFAFTGAFVLFRLQNMHQSCKDNAELLIKYPGRGKIRFAAAKNDWEEVSLLFRAYLAEQINIELHSQQKASITPEKFEKEIEKRVEITRPLQELEFIIEDKNRFVKSFKCFMLVISIVIMSSLILLPFSPILSRNGFLFWFPLATLVFMSAVCLRMCVTTILITLPLTKYKTNTKNKTAS